MPCRIHAGYDERREQDEQDGATYDNANDDPAVNAIEIVILSKRMPSLVSES